MQDSERSDLETSDTDGDSRLFGLPRLVVVVAGIALAAAIIVVLASSSGGEDAESDDLNTAITQRTDIVQVEMLPGTLGYGDAEPIVFQSSSEGIFTFKGIKQGFVTEFVDEGTVIESGTVLYHVNAEPVVVLNGTLPAYRTFSASISDGPDVQQLEQALVDLGFDPDGNITIDEDFTGATVDAIELLQESVGAEETGRLALGDVLFAPLPAFVADVFVEVSDQVQIGTPLLGTSTALSGIVTDVAENGEVVGQSEHLLSIDGTSVVLLVGEIPLYRTLAAGVEGEDVAQLQSVLLELGFGQSFDLIADGIFDERTTAAVAAWQVDVGMQPDGVVNIGDVVVQTESIRVSEMLVGLGDVVSPGTPVLTSSEASTYVTVELSTDDQDLVSIGDAVTVELPSGTQEAAVITDIGTVVLANQQGNTYFEMTVTLNDPTSAQGLDQAPVDVEVVGDSADNVLAVPVTALLALAEGGYAVEVVNSDGTTTLVAVDPGLFADGFVEVSSQSLDAGMYVVIP